MQVDTCDFEPLARTVALDAAAPVGDARALSRETPGGTVHLKSRPHIKSVMTPFPYAIDLQASLVEAESEMAAHDIHHLPVTSDHALVGVISQRDLLAARVRGGNGDGSVADVYVADPYVVDLEMPLDEVLLEMAARHVGSVLVTRHGKLAGVFTVTDACRVFGEDLRERFPPPPDGDIVA